MARDSDVFSMMYSCGDFSRSNPSKRKVLVQKANWARMNLQIFWRNLISFMRVRHGGLFILAWSSFISFSDLVMADSNLVSISDPSVQYLPPESAAGQPTVAVRYKISNMTDTEVLAYKVEVTVLDAVGDAVFSKVPELNLFFLQPGESRRDVVTFTSFQAKSLERYASAEVSLVAIRFGDGRILQLDHVER